MNEPSTFQDQIQNSGRQILIVQHLAPRAERLVGGEDPTRPGFVRVRSSWRPMFVALGDS
ncbi:MAG: hypothetical protein DMG55_02670 [Acidobacteria bacterium]|nr:MAG: hypothetical protein DMG55_02670 [Acidobacteriota bacterium]